MTPVADPQPPAPELKPLLADAIETARTAAALGVTGRVESVSGLTVRAAGLPVAIGALCEILDNHGGRTPAEVIGLDNRFTLLMALGQPRGLAAGQRVRFLTDAQKTPVGPQLLGRVIDGLGRACDHGPEFSSDVYYPLHRAAPPAMNRPRIDVPISVGIRSINALLTIGGGQRMGIFAGTGVGKSVLLGMMARHTSADVAVIALVGERGREVREFIERDLGPAGLKRSVVVVSTSDQPPPMRLRAGFVATAAAEYFRDQGANVLLLMDSVTRLAMAARQIGLAAGEPPTTKGYPPSVFAMLPALLERSGRTDRGSITGLYTVLVEGDDLNEPVSDAVRGILDGHIALSRKLAERGQYPAVGVLESISRVMPEVTSREHQSSALRVRRMLSIWTEIEDLVNIGAYAAGSNPEYDLAVAVRPLIEQFLRQGMDEGIDSAQSQAALADLAARIDQAESALRKAKAAGGERANEPRRR